MAKVKTYCHRLSASSMLEVLVAMVVFAIVFSIGIKLYVNIIQSSFSSSKLKAHLLLIHLAEQTKNDKAFVNATIQEDDVIRVEREIDPYNGNKSLLILDFKAYNQEDSLLAEHKELYSIAHE